tara:strand:- start:1570 stop:1989 length:420 start_codon:yes stop_codon:yes gene_type:complete
MKYSILIIALAFLGSFNFAQAHGDEHKKESNIHSGHHSIDSDEVTVKGQLIGMTCFIKHDSKGERHKDCFKECAEKGLPIGILTKDNVIYQISGDGHTDLRETNKKFLKYAEEQVVTKGKVYSSNGTNMIVVNGIKRAN